MIQTFKRGNQTENGGKNIIGSECYFRTLIELSPDAILVADLEGKIKFRSAGAISIFNVPPGLDVTGTSLLNWVDSSEHKKVMARIRDILVKHDAPDRREYLLRKYDGTIFWGEIVSSRVITARDTPDELLIVCRDITERKRNEEELIKAKDKAEEYDRLKNSFLQNISHEIRTPMNAIVGFASLLIEPGLDYIERKEYSEVIINSSNHLLSLLDEILEVSNIEAGTLKTKSEEICINSVLRSVYNKFSGLAKQKNINLILDTPYPDDEACIPADAILLKQVLYILTDNALKFTDSGFVHLGYSLKGNEAVLFVSDTGIGIPLDFQKKIFDNFFRVEKPETKQFQGLGLGLAIARAYVTALGGDLKLTSFPGLGSKFYFNIPGHGKNGKKHPSHTYGIEAKDFNPGTRKILVAMDINAYNISLWHFLSNYNVDIVYAHEGKDAMEIFRTNNDIDLVLMDTSLPDTNFAETIEEMKKLKSWVPVRIHNSQTDEIEKPVTSGYDDSSLKSSGNEELLKTIRKFLLGVRCAS